MKTLYDIYEGVFDKDNKHNVGSNIKDRYKLGNVFDVFQMDGESRSFNWLSNDMESKVSGLKFQSSESEKEYKDAARMDNCGVKNKAKMMAFFLWLDNLDISKFASADFSDLRVHDKFAEFINDEISKQGLWADVPGIMFTIVSKMITTKNQVTLILANPTHTYNYFMTYRFKDSQ